MAANTGFSNSLLKVSKRSERSERSEHPKDFADLLGTEVGTVGTDGRNTVPSKSSIFLRCSDRSDRSGYFQRLQKMQEPPIAKAI
jgi:hypothetical protein